MDKTLKEKIEDRINRGWDNNRIAKALGIRHGPVNEVRGKTPAAKEKPPQGREMAVRGIVIGAQTRLSDRRPNEGIKAKIYELQKGRAFPIDELSHLWAVGRETLAQHAKRLDCVKYVEVSPGSWVQCILHPDTAANLGG